MNAKTKNSAKITKSSEKPLRKDVTVELMFVLLTFFGAVEGDLNHLTEMYKTSNRLLKRGEDIWGTQRKVKILYCGEWTEIVPYPKYSVYLWLNSYTPTRDKNADGSSAFVIWLTDEDVANQSPNDLKETVLNSVKWEDIAEDYYL
jgi:hypothetical protein